MGGSENAGTRVTPLARRRVGRPAPANRLVTPPGALSARAPARRPIRRALPCSAPGARGNFLVSARRQLVIPQGRMVPQCNSPPLALFEGSPASVLGCGRCCRWRSSTLSTTLSIFFSSSTSAELSSAIVRVCDDRTLDSLG